MKKIIALIAILTLAMAGNVFALSCNMAQTPGQPDECTTLVTIASDETTLVSAGSVLVLDLNASSPKQGIQRVKVSETSKDTAVGVAQTTIASGITTTVLVRGYGKIKVNSSGLTGYKLYTAASAGTGVTPATSGDNAIATLLEDSAPKQAAQAFINIV